MYVVTRFVHRVLSLASLLFITMCHGTWNYLSEVHCLRSFLYAWRDDNFWLHGIGGWTIGIWIIAHVWSLILPSIFDGYTNRMQGGPVELPLQVKPETVSHDVWRTTPRAVKCCSKFTCFFRPFLHACAFLIKLVESVASTVQYYLSASSTYFVRCRNS